MPQYSPMFRWLRDKWKRDLVTIRERRVKEKRERKVLCPNCGYDIKGMPDHPCSECGLFIAGAWRQGRCSAGTPIRRFLPWMLGIMAVRPMLMGFGLLASLAFAMQRIEFPIGEIETPDWVFMAALLTLSLVGFGVLCLAMIRRRWLTYGPRRYALLTAGIAMLTLLGTGEVVARLAQSLGP